MARQVPPGPLVELAATELIERLRDEVAQLGDPPALRAWNRANGRRGSRLPSTIVHGDFAPWNILMNGGSRRSSTGSSPRSTVCRTGISSSSKLQVCLIKGGGGAEDCGGSALGLSRARRRSARACGAVARLVLTRLALVRARRRARRWTGQDRARGDVATPSAAS